MNKNLMIGVIVLVLIGAGAYFYMNRQTPSADITNTTTNDAVVKEESSESVAEQKSENTATETATTDQTTKEFTLSASSFKYDITEIRVKKGDTVKITLNNTGGMHDWMVAEFNAKTKQITDGQTDTISFVADKAGEFEYYCSVGNHRAMGMVGKLIVEE